MSSTSALLATITEMQARLLEVQQQLATQLRREAGHPTTTTAPVAPSAPVVGPTPRGRIPYTYPGSQATMNTAIRLQSPESLYAHSGHSGSGRGGRGGRGGLRGGRGGHTLPHAVDSGHNGLDRGHTVHGSRGGSVRGSLRGGAVRGGRGGYKGQGQGQGHEERKETVELDALLALNESVFFHVIVKKDSEGKPVYATCRSTFDGSVLTVVESEAAPSLIGQQSSKPGVILYQFMDALKESGQLKRSFTIAPWKLCYVVREGQTHTLESLLFEALGKARVVQQAVSDSAVAIAVADSDSAVEVADSDSAVAVSVTEEPVASVVAVESISTPKPRAKPKMRKPASKVEAVEVEEKTA